MKRISECPYKDDVHLDAGVYDGLKRKAFFEGRDAQLDSCEKEYDELYERHLNATLSHDRIIAKVVAVGKKEHKAKVKEIFEKNGWEIEEDDEVELKTGDYIIKERQWQALKKEVNDES